jgi:hypothetical protein
MSENEKRPGVKLAQRGGSRLGAVEGFKFEMFKSGVVEASGLEKCNGPTGVQEL